jgi:HSP20 family molecular chaperone IbpA
MNRLFEGCFEGTPALRPYSPTYPAMNVWGDGDCACLQAELPGMSMNDLDLHVLGSRGRLQSRYKVRQPDPPDPESPEI